jgi:hypothetical protein
VQRVAKKDKNMPEEVLAAEPKEDLNAPKPIILSAEKEQELINKVVKNYDEVKTSAWFTKKLEDLKTYHSAYLGYMPPTSFPWEHASNVDLGVIEMCVDNIKSRYKLSTIGATPMFNAIPETEEGEAFKSQIVDGMTYILNADIEVDTLLDTISQRTVESGT